MRSLRHLDHRFTLVRPIRYQVATAVGCIMTALACGNCSSTRDLATSDFAPPDAGKPSDKRGLDGAPPGFPCNATGPMLLAPPSQVEIMDGGPFVLADAHGWVVAWSHGFALSTASEAGVFAARPGSSPVRIADGDARGLAVVALAPGFLFCWWPEKDSIAAPAHVDCTAVDERLEPTGGVTSFPYWAAAGFPLLNGQPHVVLDLLNGGTKLMPIDVRGRSAGPAVSLPCSPLAWRSQELACLVRSQAACGAPFNEPPDCKYLLRRIAPDGAQIGVDTPVAPFDVEVQLAAREDGYLISWLDASGLHARVAQPDGTVGPLTDVRVSMANFGSTSTAVPDGYVVSWSANGSPPGSAVPMFAVFDPNATLVGPPKELGRAAGQLFQFPASIVGRGNGLAAAWLGEQLPPSGQGYSTSDVFFRALGCAQSQQIDAGQQWPDRINVSTRRDAFE